MPCENSILESGELLDKKGNLVESGYSFSQIKRYDRKAIKGNKLRIKEWDYYYFGDDKHIIALTVADNSYMSLGSVSVVDFSHMTYITKSKIGFMPRGKLRLPPSCDTGDVAFKKSGVRINFRIDNGKRTLTAEYPRFDGKLDFSCKVELSPARGDNITTATPFQKPRKFYYNTKINCLTGNGWFRIGDEKYDFANASGGLDWGRGVWPYNNVWYWSSLSTFVDGIPFGLNLGYGFGNPAATENVIFYNGKANKLSDVKFEIPYTGGELDYLKPWRIADNDDRLQMTFYPIVDRKDKMNALILSTNQHQVFGKFFGKATLDDGSIINVAETIGFAEHVVNKW